MPRILKRSRARWWVGIVAVVLMLVAVGYSNGAVGKAVHRTVRAVGKWVAPSRMAHVQEMRAGDSNRGGQRTSSSATFGRDAASLSEHNSLAARRGGSGISTAKPALDVASVDSSMASGGAGRKGSGTAPSGAVGNRGPGPSGTHVSSGQDGVLGAAPANPAALPGTVKYFDGKSSGAATANVPDTEWTIHALSFTLLLAMCWRKLSSRPVL